MSEALRHAAEALEQAAAALRQASLDHERLLEQAGHAALRKAPELPELIGAAEAMRVLGLRSRTTLDQLTRGKSFRKKIGGLVRFNRPALLRWAMRDHRAPLLDGERRAS